MPTYYFHLREDGDVTIDTEGVTLPDIVAAARHAAAEARGMVSVELCYGDAVDLTRRLEVVDEAGSIVHVLPFDEAIKVMMANK